MLLRAAEVVLVVEAVGVRARERADVGVELEQASLGDQVVGRAVEHALDLLGREVVAEHEPLEVGEPGLRGAGLDLEADALALLGGLALVDRVDLEQRLAGRHLRVGGDEHLAHAPVDGRGQRALHLHRLGDRDDVAGLYLVALGDRDRDHDARAVAADQAALVARDAVRHAVDLDEQVGVLQRGDGAVGVAAKVSRLSCTVSGSTVASMRMPSTSTR